MTSRVHAVVLFRLPDGSDALGVDVQSESWKPLHHIPLSYFTQIWQDKIVEAAQEGKWDMYVGCPVYTAATNEASGLKLIP